MSLSETIKCLVLDGYAIRFEKQSKSSMTIFLSNGHVFSCRGCYTGVMDDEDLRKILEYMKKKTWIEAMLNVELRRKGFEYEDFTR